MNHGYEVVLNYQSAHNELNVYRHNSYLLLGITYSCIFGLVTFVYLDLLLNNFWYFILSFFGFPLSFIIIFRIIQKIYFYIYPNRLISIDFEQCCIGNYQNKFTSEFYRDKLIKNHKLIQNNQNECPICLEVRDENIRLLCNKKLIFTNQHEFCMLCTIDWLKKKKNTCPMCREIILTDKMLDENED